MTVRVYGPRDVKRLPAGARIVNVTSSGREYRGLSPFLLGPVDLYDGLVSRTMENSWQFSKAYPQHVENGRVTAEWWEWARRGWADSRAHRYPMGKGAKPLFSWWRGRCLNYIQARIAIYWPLYKRAARETECWRELQELRDPWLFDFDGRLDDQDLCSVVLDGTKPMGHAYVLNSRALHALVARCRWSAIVQQVTKK